MRELVEYIAKHLVENTDDVEVDESETEAGKVVELRVADSDRGKVIGKKGRTAHAMRTLLHAATPHKPIRLEILD